MITLEPIGYVRTPYKRFYDAPRQPGIDDLLDVSVVELLPGMNFEQALHDLEGCDRIWLITHFHQAPTWKPKVLPPRGRLKRGVFATRSPHRPNPIGITCCRLLAVKGLCLEVQGTDLLDMTPVLDIKPYVAYADAFPESLVAWMSDLPQDSYTVTGDDLAALPADVQDYVLRTLQADPLPHPYRRIEPHHDGTYMLSIRQYRVVYRIDGDIVCIEQTRVVL